LLLLQQRGGHGLDRCDNCNDRDHSYYSHRGHELLLREERMMPTCSPTSAF
jgi:hypothetical protein